MNVQISHRSLANLELVDAVDAGKQVACPVYIARSALCHADSLCFQSAWSPYNAKVAVDIAWCAVCLVHGFNHGGAASAIKPVW